MAKLILEVCPYVDIYVARLDRYVFFNQYRDRAGCRHYFYELDNKKTVEKTEQEAEQHLIEQIEEAGKTGKNIILFCAAEDEGEYGQGNSLPASTNSKAIKRIGSSNRKGKTFIFLKEEHVDFLFPSEDILTDIAWYQKDGKKRQGSSA
ncbi:hypothetical protein GGS24DRAFT_508856 [Hypoxylon argillaceum]|nr:hypothetical protein GGS24DRAFT_508856 [Hypoxylon argillaceum]